MSSDSTGIPIFALEVAKKKKGGAAIGAAGGAGTDARGSTDRLGSIRLG
jgi:hypothetical protein